MSNALEQANAQMSSIADMVAALNCDYDRLDELREERANLFDELEEAADCVRWHHNDELDEDGTTVEHKEYRRCRDELAAWDEENAEELAELEEIADDCESEEEARERIEQDALEVAVRSEWYSPGETDVKPEQFYILLCTGGPAVRIMGELNGFGQPDRAWLEYQDWGTPWTERVNGEGEMGALIAYAECFYFGDC